MHSAASNFLMNKMNLRERFRKLDITPLMTLKVLIAVFAIVVVIIGAYVCFALHDLPQLGSLNLKLEANRTSILDRKGQVIATYGNIYGAPVVYENLPKSLVQAVLATEDRKFFSHKGVDIAGMIRASLANLRKAKIAQGGSTISQQLVKLLVLTPQRTMRRKLQQVILALELERTYSKEAILCAYLNNVYLGSGIYGVDAGAKYYFAKNLHQLTLGESAVLAGLIKAPTRYAPTNNQDLAGNRGYQVLLNMVDAGYISKEQMDAAVQESVDLDVRLLGSGGRNHFTEWVHESVKRQLDGKSEDVIVGTSYDQKIQEIAQKELVSTISQISESSKVKQGAVVVMDFNGDVLAMVGGANYSKSSFNRAVQSARPAGSAAKLFVYLAALDYGMTPDTEVEDKPIKFGDWEPKNYFKDYKGIMPLRDAFALSTNTISVHLTHEIGLSRVIQMMRRLGISSPLPSPDLTIALGSFQASLLEMTTAYAIVGNNGFDVTPHAISYIRRSSDGEVIFVQDEAEPRRAIERHLANQMRSLLRSTVEYGTASAANIPQVVISGKTGTSQDNRDAWFIGYSDQYIVGVWLGNDDYSPMKNIVGGNYPTFIGRNILRSISTLK